jgi:hypothetical protein
VLNDIGMNEKNPEGPSVVMDLRISHHCAQVPIIPVKLSVIWHIEIKERHFREDKVWEFLCLKNQVTWHEAYVESDVNAKSDVFLDVFFYYCNTTFSAKTVYLRE